MAPAVVSESQYEARAGIGQGHAGCGAFSGTMPASAPITDYTGEASRFWFGSWRD